MSQYAFFILNRQQGHSEDLPGAMMALPPRRAHRMRRRDSLLIYLHQEGNAPLGAKEQKALVAKLAERYFTVGGSVTAALKELAQALNAYFLNRNRKLAGQGKHAIGWLTLAVWRENVLYLALSGPMHAVVIGETIHRYHDPELSGRGLGVGKAARVYFARTTVQPGDALLLTPRMPAAWNDKTLRLEANRKISPLLRRLLAYGGERQESVLVHLRPGEDEVRRVVLRAESALSAAPEPEPQITEEVSTPAAPAPKTETAPAAPAPPRPTSPPESRPAATAPPAAPQTRPTPASPPHAPQKQPGEDKGKAKAAPQARPPSRKRLPAMGEVMEPLRKGLAALWRLGEKAANAFRSITRQGLSTSADEVFALPSSFMALAAIAVPLVVVTIAVIVFVRRGNLQQYQTYMTLAQAEARHAETIQDPVTRRNALVEALHELQAAETFRSTADSRALRQKLTAALDKLDGVRRLDFQPVSERLPGQTTIKRLLFQGADMYALSADGRVYHFQLQAQHYVLDNDFQCAGGQYGEMEVGPLISATLLTRQVQPGAYSIAAIDANRHSVFCGVGKPSMALAFPPMTPVNWKQPRVVAYQDSELYVLDPAAKLVGKIRINGEGEFDTTPYNYFSGAPDGIASAIDIAVMRGGLYLLRSDGQITRCLEAKAGAAKCETLTYQDTRPGRSPSAVMANTRFSQLVLAASPDPSLYLLDAASGAVYRFSYQLHFVTQYRPLHPLPGPITAFAVDPEMQILFVAAGQRIYQASLQ